MGIMASHVQKDKKTGRLSYRRVYPEHLRPFIPKQPHQLKRSLASTSLKDREALSKLADAQAEYERTIQAAQRKADGTTRPLSPLDFTFLTQTYAHRLRKSLIETHYDDNDDGRAWFMASAWRYAPFGLMDSSTAEASGRERVWSNSERIREALPDLLGTWRSLRADGRRTGIIEAEGQSADDLLTEFFLQSDRDESLYFELCLALLKQDIATGEQLSRLVTQGDDIEPVEQPQPFDRSGPVVPLAPSEAVETLTSLAERLIAQKVDPVGLSTQQSWNTALRLWRETFDDIDCNTVTRRKVTEWLDLLSQRPTGIARSDEQVPLPELVLRYANDPKVGRISGKTIRQHLGSLSAIWNKSEKRGWLEAVRNPFANHEVRVNHKSGGNLFTTKELNAIFATSVFTAGERPRGGRGEAAYWIPLLLLFTGARPGEVAQLLVSDFSQDDSGKWIMQYVDEGEHPQIGRRTLKTSRHGTGSRKFPVPTMLIALGLPAYLKWLRNNGEKAFFPMLTNTTKGLHEHWSRWWGPYLREQRAIPEGKRQAREFRHHFATALRESGVSDEAISYLIGHSVRGGSTTRSYGDRSPYGAEIAKLRFEGLDLSKVKVWTAENLGI